MMGNAVTEEYIRRSEALDAIRRFSTKNEAQIGYPNVALNLAIEAIENIPAADAAPVVRGTWLEDGNLTISPDEYDDYGEPIWHDHVVYRCNRCGRTCKRKEPYCNCGAKMEVAE